MNADLYGVAEQVTARLGMDHDATVDTRLRALTEALSAQVHCTVGTSGVDGRVLIGEDTAQVWLDSRLGAAQRRFVLAHELAHVILSRPSLCQHHDGPLDTGDQSEEALCDAIASALLVPRQTVHAMPAAIDLETLVDTACAIGTSVSVLAHRVAHVRRQPVPLLLLRRAGTGWVATRSAGFGMDAILPRELTDTTELDQLCAGRTAPVGFGVIGAQKARWWVTAQARRDGDAATVFVQHRLLDVESVVEDRTATLFRKGTDP